MSEITPSSAIRNFWIWFPVGAIVLLVIATLVYLVSQGSWWWQNQDIQHQYKNTVNSQGYQTTLVTGPGGMESRFSDITDLTAQRSSEPLNSPLQGEQHAQQLAALRIFCTDASQLQPGFPLASQLQPVIKANCVAGVPVANPPIIK